MRASRGQTVKWAFTTFDAANYHPLTWLSHALDCQLFGVNAAAHHEINVLFHAANAVLLFLLLLEGYRIRVAESVCCCACLRSIR